VARGFRVLPLRITVRRRRGQSHFCYEPADFLGQRRGFAVSPVAKPSTC
jgi:hypothetical protein